MTGAIRAVLILGLTLSVSACARGDRFGAGATDPAAVGAVAGGPQDPTSPAYFSQTVGDRVLFAVDESTLGDQARGTLQGQAQWLASNPDYTAVIEGHADEQGTREYNLALGARRAASVEQFLISQGVSPARLRTVTFGKERPIEICSAEACYARNRRAVTVVATGAGPVS